MSTIVLRQTKGSALTFAEGDANFSNLNTDKLEDITNESIGDLSDVVITTPSTGEALVYTAGGQWENQTLSSVSNLTDLGDVDPAMTATDGQILVYNNTSGFFEAQTKTFATGSELSNIVEDTTPQLGGDLDGQNNVVSAVELKDYKETVNALGSNDSPSIDAANGNIQSVQITSGLTIPDISNFDAGATLTLFVTGNGTASDGTTSSICKFANAGATTLTNYSLVSIFNDGTNYFVSIATDFA